MNLIAVAVCGSGCLCAGAWTEKARHSAESDIGSQRQDCSTAQEPGET